MTKSAVTKVALERRFVESGERERMKELLIQRLRESGWVEEVENMCRTYIQSKGVENVTLEGVVNEVKVRARRAVPDDVKRDLMECVRQFLQQESGIADL